MQRVAVRRMKEYAELLEHDPKYADRAQQFAAKVRDVTEYLAEVGLSRAKAQARRRGLRTPIPATWRMRRASRRQPRELLKAIGVKLVEMPRADSCCGSAGVYNVVQNEISMKILDEKMEYVAMVKPEIVATANIGCMLQLAAGAKRKRMNTRVAHVIELLDQVY